MKCASLLNHFVPQAYAQSATEDLRETISNEIGVDPGLTPGAIVTRVLPYLYVLAGFILFIMIIWGGFEMLTGATDPKSQEAGKQRITAALIGFVLLFVSYWIAQIIQFMFNIRFL